MHFTLPRDKIKDMVEIVYNRNCVYQTAYHVIWCPKYRKRILKGEIAKALRLAITAICIEREWPILTLEIQPDHIHLFVTIPPSHLATVQPAQGRLSDGSNQNVRSWCTARLQRHAFGVEHVPVVDQQPSELLEG